MEYRVEFSVHVEANNVDGAKVAAYKELFAALISQNAEDYVTDIERVCGPDE